MDIVLRVAERRRSQTAALSGNDLVAFVALRLRTWTTPFFPPGPPARTDAGPRRGAWRKRSVIASSGIGSAHGTYSPFDRCRRAASRHRSESVIDILMGTLAMPLLFFQDFRRRRGGDNRRPVSVRFGARARDANDSRSATDAGSA